MYSNNIVESFNQWTMEDEFNQDLDLAHKNTDEAEKDDAPEENHARNHFRANHNKFKKMHGGQGAGGGIQNPHDKLLN